MPGLLQLSAPSWTLCKTSPNHHAAEWIAIVSMLSDSPTLSLPIFERRPSDCFIRYHEAELFFMSIGILAIHRIGMIDLDYLNLYCISPGID